MRRIMKAVRLGAALASLAMLAGCTTGPLFGNANKGLLYSGFEPVEPGLRGWYCEYNATDECTPQLWSRLNNNSTKINALLPDQIATTVIKEYSMDGTVSFTPARVTAADKYYEVVIDYAKYRPEYVAVDDLPPGAVDEQDNSTLPAQVRIGVGVRVVAKVWSASAGADISGLPALAVGVHTSGLSGTISAHAIGIDSRRMNGQLPLGLKLDASSIQTVLQAVASIQTRIYDEDVILTPQILAVKTVKPPVGGQSDVREAKKSGFVRAIQQLLLRKIEAYMDKGDKRPPAPAAGS